MNEKKEQSKRNIIEKKENRKKQRLQKQTKTKIVSVTKNITTKRDVVRNIFKPLASKRKSAETITSELFKNNKTKQFADVLTLKRR